MVVRLEPGPFIFHQPVVCRDGARYRRAVPDSSAQGHGVGKHGVPAPPQLGVAAIASHVEVTASHVAVTPSAITTEPNVRRAGS